MKTMPWPDLQTPALPGDLPFKQRIHRQQRKAEHNKTSEKKMVVTILSHAGYRADLITMLGSRPTEAGKQRPKLESRSAAEFMEDLGVIVETAKEKLQAGTKLRRVKGDKT